MCPLSDLCTKADSLYQDSNFLDSPAALPYHSERMSTYRQKIGRWGEQAAADYLASKGYEILERNLYTPHGEIDIISRLDGLTVLVEVKTRTSKRFGYPEEAINTRKQAHLLACAEYYAQANDLDTWQIDAISVEGKPGQEVKITHFENVIG